MLFCSVVFISSNLEFVLFGECSEFSRKYSIFAIIKNKFRKIDKPKIYFSLFNLICSNYEKNIYYESIK